MLNALHRNAILVVLSLSSLAACSSSETVETGSGGQPNTDCATHHAADDASLCEAGALPDSSCTPKDASCGASASRCLALVDQSQSQVFGLRMAQLTVAAPGALASTGVLGYLIQYFTQPDRALCNLQGQGSLSWLLEVDLAAGTIKTGGAFPPADPKAGYAFQDTMLPALDGPRHVAPVTLSLTSSPPCEFSTSAADLTIPMYTDADGSKVVLVPLHQVRIHGQISADHACIGAFDPIGQEAACCIADVARPAYRDGGTVEGFFALEEVDSFDSGLGESLCVALSQDADTFGDKTQMPTRCKRDAQGHILLKGDWCAATNQPATADCADAMQFSATFAASGVAITN